jgi:3-(3-hydroxy-phenyl)propionate hydroxylase
VVAVAAHADRVVVGSKDGRSWQAQYVIAADDARSVVRSALGIALHGRRSKGFPVVVDVGEDSAAPRPVERVLHYEHPAPDGRTVLLVPFAGGFQVDLQCHDDDVEEDFATVDAVRRWLPRVVDRKYADRVLWVSRYHFLQKVAETFIDPQHRVLLTGESAHLFAPFGASNPVRASGAVADFDLTRRAAGQYNCDAAASALAHLHPPGRLKGIHQWCAAMATARLPRCGEWLDSVPYGPAAPPPCNPTGRY